MQDYNSKLKSKIKNCKNLDEILKIVKLNIQNAKMEKPDLKIVYVAGKVTTDGKNKILPNLKRLNTYTQRLVNKYGFVFSAADVFDGETYWKLNVAKPLHEKDFYKFWQNILKSGVTDIYMTPDWKKSLGATDEFKTAKNLDIAIHYFKK